MNGVRDWPIMSEQLPVSADAGWSLAVASAAPGAVDEAGFRTRLAVTALSVVEAVLAIPALVLWILSVLSIALAPLGVGIVLANLTVPATALLTGLHRRLAGLVLGEQIRPGYRSTAGRGPIGRTAVWFRDSARWREFAFLAFSATGGFTISLLVACLLLTPIGHLLAAIAGAGWLWFWLAVVIGPISGLVWWLTTPALVRARALAERGMLGSGATELRQRVQEVTTSRAEALDHSAAEIRRIERDLHDGAQARIASVGIHIGLAEQLIETDPKAAIDLLRETRASTVAALGDLRSVVRGIHPPALADRGLSGAVRALAEQLALPITVSDELAGRAPAPVESAVYFAVAECLANAVKHADAVRGWVRLRHADGVLVLVVGDDGSGGANAASPGLTGVRKRLSAFDGTMVVDSPVGGPTIMTMEVPCELLSPKTTPYSGTGSPES